MKGSHIKHPLGRSQGEAEKRAVEEEVEMSAMKKSIVSSTLLLRLSTTKNDLGFELDWPAFISAIIADSVAVADQSSHPLESGIVDEEEEVPENQTDDPKETSLLFEPGIRVTPGTR